MLKQRIAARTSGPEPQLGKDVDPEEGIDEFIKDRENYATEEAQAAIRSYLQASHSLSKKLNGEENSLMRHIWVGVQF